jgi:very-short-patch-repair endonuclease
MNKHRYSSNKAEYKQFRKSLRNRSTSAEAALWNLIKNKQINGKKFRRQHSLENYIVDFYCSSDKMIIELDGNPHGENCQIRKDEVRDRFFETNGYKVIRFENKLVFQDPEYVIETINSNFNKSTELLPKHDYMVSGSNV